MLPLIKSVSNTLALIRMAVILMTTTTIGGHAQDVSGLKKADMSGLKDPLIQLAKSVIT